MLRFRVWGTVCLVFCSMVCGFASIIQAAEPTDAIPDVASIVVRWKTPQATLGKLGDFLDAVQPGIGNFVTAAGLPSAGQLFGNQELAGVDTTKDWWIIVFAESGGEQPSVVFMVTAKDVDALKDAVSEDYETHVADKLVVYSDDEDALAQVRDQLQGKGTGLWSKADPAAKKLFDGADLSVLVNVKQLVEEFEDELNQAEPKLDALVDQLSMFTPEDQKDQVKAIFDVYRDIGNSGLKCIRDSNSLALGVTFSKSAIRYESTLQVNKESSTASYLAKQATSALPVVTRLPVNQSIYFGARTDMKAMMEWSMKVNKSLMKGISAADSAKVDAAMKELAKLKFEDMGGYIDIGSSAPAARYGGVSMVSPTKQLRDFSQALFKAMSKVEVPGLTQTMKLEPGFDKIDGVEVDRMTVKQEFKADPTGTQSKIIKLFFGENGMQQLAMYQPTRSVQVLGGKADLQALIKALDTAPATGSPVAAARQRLAEKANAIVLVDVARLILNGAQLVASGGDLPIDVSALEGMKLDSSFLGFSLTCEPTAIRSQVDIPVVQIQNIVKVVMPLARPAQ